MTTRMPARPRRADRPAPDWDLVLRRNSIERLKQERPPMHVRDELPGLIARGYEDIPEEDMVRFHWWGLAHDKPKIGTFMVRVKVAGGLVRPAQLKALGAIARDYGKDEAELTTRQGIQLHWVHMSMLPADQVGTVLERLAGGWLRTRDSNGHAAGYTFGDFAAELSDEALLALATGAGEGGGADAAGQADAVLHVPGPLLNLVGGADEIKISATTVAGALAAVAAAHPAFSQTVFPGGKVAEAFLITVGDDDIRNLDGLATPVTPGTDITIVMAMSGG